MLREIDFLLKICDWFLASFTCGVKLLGLRSVLLRHTHKPQKGPIPICVSRSGNVRHRCGGGSAGPTLFWQGHSKMMGADIGDESAESRSAFQPLRIPLVIHPEHGTSVVVVFRWTDELCGGYKWVSRFEMLRISNRWTGERWVEQMSRLHATLCYRQGGSISTNDEWNLITNSSCNVSFWEVCNFYDGVPNVRDPQIFKKHWNRRTIHV